MVKIISFKIRFKNIFMQEQGDNELKASLGKSSHGPLMMQLAVLYPLNIYWMVQSVISNQGKLISL